MGSMGEEVMRGCCCCFSRLGCRERMRNGRICIAHYHHGESIDQAAKGGRNTQAGTVTRALISRPEAGPEQRTENKRSARGSLTWLARRQCELSLRFGRLLYEGSLCSRHSLRQV